MDGGLFGFGARPTGTQLQDLRPRGSLRFVAR